MNAIRLAFCAAIGMLALFGGTAQAWEPKKPIRIIVGFSPGGGTDIVARTIVASAQEFFPVPLVVVNKPGAGGTLAAEFVSKAEPDGYTLLVAGGSESTSVPNHRKVNYSINDDFVGIIRLIRSRIFFGVKSDSEIKSIADLAKIAKANPGKLSYASSGQGSILHSSMLLLASDLKADLRHVPYKGGAPAMAAMLGGHVDIAMIGGPEEAQAHLAAGKIRLLATPSDTRFPGFPEVPTLKELGHDVYVDNMKGLVAPKATPDEAVKYLHDTFKRGLDSKVWEKLAAKLKLETGYLSGEDFMGAMKTMSGKIGKAVKGL